MVDLSATNVALAGESIARAKEWQNWLLQTLNAEALDEHSDEVVPVASQALVGVYACAFVKKKHLPFLHDVDVTTTAVGMMGMGNKGAVCLRFRLHDSTFCFVCSHLAAHREKIDARNKDFASIMERTEFKGDGESLSVGDAGGRPAR